MGKREAGTSSKENCQNVTGAAELKQTSKDEGEIVNHHSGHLPFLPYRECVERPELSLERLS